jgi:hypothetical protein
MTQVIIYSFKTPNMYRLATTTNPVDYELRNMNGCDRHKQYDIRETDNPRMLKGLFCNKLGQLGAKFFSDTVFYCQEELPRLDSIEVPKPKIKKSQVVYEELCF